MITPNNKLFVNVQQILAQDMSWCYMTYQQKPALLS